MIMLIIVMVEVVMPMLMIILAYFSSGNTAITASQ